MNDKTVNAGQNQEAGQNPKAEQDSGEVFFQEVSFSKLFGGVFVSLFGGKFRF